MSSRPASPAPDAEKGVYGPTVIKDDVFGEITDDGPNYRNVSAVGALVLLTKTNFGLGVLTIPSVLHTFGIVPGIILILAMMALATYCASHVGRFKLRHPEVYALADAGNIVGGRVVQMLTNAFLGLYYMLITSSAIVSLSTGLNAVSTHGACTAVFVVVSAALGLIVGSIRTLGKVTWIGWVGMISLLVAVITLAAAVGRQERPAAAPVSGPWDKGLKVVNNPTFAQAIAGVSTILFSYGATPMFWNIASEMRDPRAFNKAMVSSMSIITVLYLVIGGVVYGYCGQYVSSPALGSAGALMKKVSYGLALPALVATLTVFAHCAGKHWFVLILKGSPHMTSNSPTHFLTWFGCMFGNIVLGYIIASAIPNFGSIISLVGSVIIPTVAIWPYIFLWWHDNWRFASAEERRQWWRRAELALNILCCLLGLFITVAGTYGSVLDVIDSSAAGGPWSCKDNSNSV
ncbi:hypothetical protein VHUM_02112 [Vanrija humicola]|uniref:Amino acid transporter transmembrane domain-containing protein n=1 Tax=Vanrija humicola TaxID=5417 RepID=A0A7D8UZW2_VANHU|nr:hypothetical protein VHUM_02112 [Vanrija humicola]